MKSTSTTRVSALGRSLSRSSRIRRASISIHPLASRVRGATFMPCPSQKLAASLLPGPRARLILPWRRPAIFRSDAGRATLSSKASLLIHSPRCRRINNRQIILQPNRSSSI
jgi:hypothetical protein